MENTTINLSIPKPLLDSVDKQAETEFRNRSELIREAIRNYLIEKSATNRLVFTDEENLRVKNMQKIIPLSEGVYFQLSAAFRPQPNDVPDLFKGGKNELIKLVENPPSFRKMGWDLRTLDSAKPVAGEYLQLTAGFSKVLRFFRDGQIIYSQDQEFIGHAVNKEGQDTGKFSINSLAIAESITNFVYFIYQYKEFLSRTPDTAIIKINLENPNNDKVELIGVRGNNNFSSKIGNTLKELSVERHIQIDLTGSIDKDVSAYKLLAEFFYFFGLMDVDLLYTKKDEYAIDINKLIKE